MDPGGKEQGGAAVSLLFKPRPPMFEDSLVCLSVCLERERERERERESERESAFGQDRSAAVSMKKVISGSHPPIKAWLRHTFLFRSKLLPSDLSLKWLNIDSSKLCIMTDFHV